MVSEPNPGQEKDNPLRNQSETEGGASPPNKDDATIDYPLIEVTETRDSLPESPAPTFSQKNILHQSHETGIDTGSFHFTRPPDPAKNAEPDNTDEPLPTAQAADTVISRKSADDDDRTGHVTDTFIGKNAQKPKSPNATAQTTALAASDSGPPSGISFSPGTMLGHFVVSKYIGGGGMGRVYLGIDKSLDRKVAIKVLQRQRAQDQFSVARFMNEARSAARLNHEHIAQVYYAGQQDDVPFIAFEYVEGTNIRSIVENQGVFSIPQTMTYMIQIAHALDHAAFHGVVHRDVKPSNILITKEGRAKLIDMGLARLLKPTDPGDDLTASGVTLGTFDYISPEQARDPRNADIRSDIYSLGCTFFYMLAGRPPFHEGTVLQKLLQHQGDEPPDIRTFAPGVPDEIALLMQRMMAKDPRQRFQTPTALLAELTEVARHIGLRPSGPGNTVWTMRSGIRPSKLLTHLPWMTALVLFFVATFILTFYWGSEGESPPVVVAPAPQPSNTTDGGTATTESGVAASEETYQPVWSRVAPKLWNGEQVDAGFTRTRWPEGNPPVSGVKTSFDLEKMRVHPTVILPANGGTSPDQPTPAANKERYLSANASTLPRRYSSGAGVSLLSASSSLDLLGSLAPLYADAFSRPQGGLSGPSIVATNPTPTVLIVDPSATRSEEGVHSTLGAAITAAGKNTTIELRFNGTGKENEKNETVSLAGKHLTIQAGIGFSPSISFRPTSSSDVRHGRSGQIACFLLNASDVTFKKIAFEMDVSSNVIAEKWALFEILGLSRVRFDDCTFTVRHPNSETSGFHGVSLFRTLTLSRSETAPGGGTIAMSEGGTSGVSTLADRDSFMKDRSGNTLSSFPMENFSTISDPPTMSYTHGSSASLSASLDRAGLLDEGSDWSSMRTSASTGDKGNLSEYEAETVRWNRIILNNCIVRGETGFLDVESNRSTRVMLNNVFIAISLPLVNLRGVPYEVSRNSEVAISFEHLSCYTRAGLCRYTKTVDASPLPVHWNGKYSVFRFTGAALTEFQGFRNLEEVLPYFKWIGERNFFQGPGSFAEIKPDGIGYVTQHVTLKEWKERWFVEDSIDVDVLLPAELDHKRTSYMTPSDLTLSTQEYNPARGIAPAIFDNGSSSSRENAGVVDRLLPEIR